MWKVTKVYLIHHLRHPSKLSQNNQNFVPTVHQMLSEAYWGHIKLQNLYKEANTICKENIRVFLIDEFRKLWQISHTVVKYILLTAIVSRSSISIPYVILRINQY